MDLRLFNQFVNKIRAARQGLKRLLVAVRADEHAAVRSHLEHVAAIAAFVFDGHKGTALIVVYKVFGRRG
jgi:DNA-binding IclR family transcriptional regulator